MSEFLMPSLGADMEKGTVVGWQVKPGDRVTRGQVVVLVETEKGIIEVEIWQDGRVEELLVAEGETVPVGTPIALLAGAEETEAVPRAKPAPSKRAKATPPLRHLARELGVDLEEVAGTGPGGAPTREDVKRAARPIRQRSEGAPTRVRASPLARRTADELGVDLAALSGTGPDGSVTREDVLAAVSTAEVDVHPLPAEEERPDQASAMRSAIARVMSRSKREIPHYYLGTTIDLSRATRWLTETNLERRTEDRLLPAALLLRAAALAVREVPEVNGFWREDRFEPSEDVHLGVAVSLRGGGLVAPAIHHADRLTLDELMAALRDLVGRARKGGLRGSEMADPTITVTNLGERGVETAFGVIYHPQVALVGFGKIVERPWAEDGMVGARPVVTATLSGDHRVSDGHRGGFYLAAVDRLLQEPEGL